MVTPDPLNSSLHVVREQADNRPQKQFCGHCGRSPEGVARKADVPSRVCPSCGMGLLLQAPAEFAPAQSDPFLVVDGSLTICALSRVKNQIISYFAISAPSGTGCRSRRTHLHIVTRAASAFSPVSPEP